MEISEGKIPYGISTNKRITRQFIKQHRPVVCKPNPFEIAQKYKQHYEQTGSMTTVGLQFGVSRVRIHQMLNLLKLDKQIIDYIQNIKDQRQRNYWNEHRLRDLAILPMEKHLEEFQKILDGQAYIK